jgi:hypothetical protein
MRLGSPTVAVKVDFHVREVVRSLILVKYRKRWNGLLARCRFANCNNAISLATSSHLRVISQKIGMLEGWFTPATKSADKIG